MRKVFIPKGETVRFENLHTDCLIVKGSIEIAGKLTAKEILGGGNITADEIVCDNIHANILTATNITANKIAANKCFAGDCIATACIIVTDYFEADYVKTGKLTTSISLLSDCDAQEIITLPQKKRGMLGMLFASWRRSLLMSIFHRSPARKKTKQNKTTEKKHYKAAVPATAPAVPDTVDAERFRELVLAACQAMEEYGYCFRKEPVAESDLFEREEAA